MRLRSRTRGAAKPGRMQWVNELAFGGGRRGKKPKKELQVMSWKMLYCHFYIATEKKSSEDIFLAFQRAPISIITSAYCFWPAFFLFILPPQILLKSFRRLRFISAFLFVLRKRHTQAYLSQISHDITQRPTERKKILEARSGDLLAGSFIFRISSVVSYFLHREAQRKEKLNCKTYTMARAMCW